MIKRKSVFTGKEGVTCSVNQYIAKQRKKIHNLKIRIKFVRPNSCSVLDSFP